ncbi:Fatty acid synthase subunit alpha [Diplonema papillatum]|nr:Fatty acid synthase subunit alpha [Diplonema papillatum]|eukprot:gene15827-24183_t
MDDYRKALLEGLGTDESDLARVAEQKGKWVMRSPDGQAEQSQASDVAGEAASAGGTAGLPSGDQQAGPGGYCSGYGDYTEFGSLQSTKEPGADGGEKAAQQAELGELQKTLEAMVSGGGANSNTGSAVVPLTDAPASVSDAFSFLTPSEAAYCDHAPDTRSSIAGRLAAKRAVLTALGVADSDRASLYPQVEVMSSSTDAPAVLLSDKPRELAERLGAPTVKVTISHSGHYAVAAACLCKG